MIFEKNIACQHCTGAGTLRDQSVTVRCPPDFTWIKPNLELDVKSNFISSGNPEN